MTFLYIYKLFRLISNNTSHSKQHEKLVSNVTKYTFLSVIWISTGVIFWCCPFIIYNKMDYLTYLVLYYIFVLLDVSANCFAYVLGYQYADKIYMKLCSFPHRIFQRSFQCLVHSANRQESTLALHIEDHAKTIEASQTAKHVSDESNDSNITNETNGTRQSRAATLSDTVQTHEEIV